MVKILELFESVESAMMNSLHEDQRMGATAGVRDWVSKPTAVTAERFPERGKPHSARAAAQASAADRSAEMYAGGDRKTARPKSAGAIACVVKPETILGWYRRLIAQKFDGSR